MHVQPRTSFRFFPWAKQLALVIPVVIMAPFTLGCSDPNLAEVSGQITLNGEPLPDAFLVFIPSESGTTSYGKTGSDGRYRMRFSDAQSGAWLGQNRVEIRTGDIGADGSAGTPERVPRVYNDQTTLEVDVQAGRNTFDFDLESDAGQVVQPDFGEVD